MYFTFAHASVKTNVTHAIIPPLLFRTTVLLIFQLVYCSPSLFGSNTNMADGIHH